MRPQVVFLHGVGGGSDQEKWLTRLNSNLVDLGTDPLDPSSVLSPEYGSLFGRTHPASAPMPFRWKKAPEYEASRESFVLRRAELSSELASYSRATVSPLFAVPDGSQFMNLPWFDEAKQYLSNPALRNAIWSHLEAMLPTEPMILIGHSLGSVVAVDLLKRLGHARVPLFITIGSPLGALEGARKQAGLEVFPYDRVDSWINVFDPHDPVTMGRGVGRHFDAVLDLPVSQQHDAPGVAQHGAASYFEHPVIAAAIKKTIVRGGFAKELVTKVDLAADLRLPMLQFAYLQALQNHIDPKDVKRSRALRKARNYLATKFEQAARDAGWSVSDSEALRFTLMKDALASVRARFSDDELVMLAIALAGQPPAQPFDLESDPTSPERRKALTQLFDTARSATGAHTRRDTSSSSNVSDGQFADAVISAIKASAPSAGLKPLPMILVGAGLAVLAATGVGLVAALPAVGIAGAAAVTSTLAAFGPGGMVGGMAALAALTGTGSAATAAGVAAGVGGKSGAQQPGHDAWPILIQAVTHSTPTQLKAVIADLKAHILVIEKLEFVSPAATVQFSVETAIGAYAPEVAAHREIAPTSSVTKGNAEKLKTLEEFSAWLDQYIPGRTESLESLRSLESPARGLRQVADRARR